MPQKCTKLQPIWLICRIGLINFLLWQKTVFNSSKRDALKINCIQKLKKGRGSTSLGIASNNWLFCRFFIVLIQQNRLFLLISALEVHDELETEVACGGQNEYRTNKEYLVQGAHVWASYEECEVSQGLGHLQSGKCRFFVVGKQESDKTLSNTTGYLT